MPNVIGGTSEFEFSFLREDHRNFQTYYDIL